MPGIRRASPGRCDPPDNRQEQVPVFARMVSPVIITNGSIEKARQKNRAQKDDGFNGIKQMGISKNDRQGIDEPIRRLFDRKIGGSKILRIHSGECPATGKTADF
ncbi:MAG: hypothetical protein Q8L68_02805 [Methylococcales bacterium]|nr:hypothetical protein [Methylococcales bacterium]